MGYFIPDPRFEVPHLLAPRVKPDVPTVVDWSHPLSEGLLSFAMPMADKVFYECTDQTFAEPYNLTEIALVGLEQGPYGNGLIVSSSPITRFWHWTSEPAAREVRTFKAINQLRASGEGTIAVVFYSRDMADPEDPLVTARAGGTGTRTYISASGNSLATSYDDFTNTKLASISINAWHTAGLAVDASNEYSYLDGALVNTRAGGGPIAAATNLGIGTYGHSSAYSPDATIFAVAVWDRLLSAEEWTEFDRHPYQMLIPA